MADIDQYDFKLPKELVAQRPVVPRSDARLMIVDRQNDEIHHAHVRDLPDWLRPQDCLVLNDTRVVPARLDGYRVATRGRWQGLFLSADDQNNWKLLCKTRSRLRDGERIVLKDRMARDDVQLQMITRLDGGVWAARPETSESTWDLLERIGRVPLPHYIRRGEMVDDDLKWYQTVYAARRGSVAAPTAGLHLTEPLLNQIRERGVRLAQVTLHVGIGTFRPITAESLDQHEMHFETGELNPQAARSLTETQAAGGRVIAVGTTSVRVLETAAAGGKLQPWSGETDLFIRPGFEFQATDALMTNFHLPRSTLLVLTRAFGGDGLIQRAYAEAVEERYRFFSYGDAMLIL